MQIHIADCAHSKAARARLEVEALILQLAHAFSTFRPLDLPLLPQSRLKASSASLQDSFECVAAAAQEAAGRLLDAVLGVFERASHQQAPEQEQPDASPAVASLQQISALHNFRLRLQDAVGQVWLQEARQDKHSCTGQPMHKHCLQPSASSHHTHIPHPSRTSFGGSHILSTNGTIAGADRPRSVHHPQMLSATGQAFAARSEEGRNYSDPASFTISSQLCALIANSGRDSLLSGATSMCLTPQTAASSASEQRMTLGHISGPSSASGSASGSAPGSASPSTGGTHLLRSVVPVKAQNMFSRPHTYTHTHMHQLSASHQHLVFGIGTSRLSSQSGDASLGCHSQSRSNVSSAHEVAMQLAPRSWAGPASATQMQSAVDKGMIMGGRASVGGLLPGRAMHGGIIGSSTFTRSSLSGSDGCTALTHGPAAHSASTSAGMHVHASAVPGQAPVAPGPAAAAAAGLAFMRRSFWHGSQRGKPKTPAKLHRR